MFVLPPYKGRNAKCSGAEGTCLMSLLFDGDQEQKPWTTVSTFGIFFDPGISTAPANFGSASYEFMMLGSLINSAEFTVNNSCLIRASSNCARTISSKHLHSVAAVAAAIETIKFAPNLEQCANQFPIRHGNMTLTLDTISRFMLSNSRQQLPSFSLPSVIFAAP